MKDIILKITGKDFGSKDKNAAIEFYTEGQLYRRGGLICIKYPESELSGLEGCTTSLVIGPNKVKMSRSGSAYSTETIMEFEKGRRFEGVYDTPYGTVDMELLTNSIEKKLSAQQEQGRLTIDYNVSLKGLVDARKVLDIEFNEKQQ